MPGAYRGAMDAHGVIGSAAVALVLGVLAAPGAAQSDTAEARYVAVSPRAPYRAENVRIATPAGHMLAGTLTIPRGASAAPAAVLIHGTGRVDRDANVLPGFRPFKQLADALGRRGVGVLRFDKRGVGQSTGDDQTATTADLAADVRAVLAYLRARQDIDGGRLVLIGTSEGGLIAPMVAAADSAIRGIVLIAAPARSLREILPGQVRHNVVTDPSIPREARDEATEAMLSRWLALADGPWLEWALDYDPLPTVARVTQPTLIVGGEHDWQITPDQAYELALAMRAAGNDSVTVRVFPDVNHLLLADPDRHPGEYEDLPSMAVVPEVLGCVTEWVSAIAGLD